VRCEDGKIKTYFGYTGTITPGHCQRKEERQEGQESEEMTGSVIFALPPEHQALINSLLRREILSTREVSDITYDQCGHTDVKRTVKAWESILYNYKKRGHHLRVVREDNLIRDPFVVSDLMIKAIESALIPGAPVNWNVLNALKSPKSAQVSLMGKIEDEINGKIAVGKADPDSSD
jgi:hypothetical protein